MTEEINMTKDELKSANDKTISHLDSELLKIRVGKASPDMLHGVMVDYYGSPTPLQQVANVRPTFEFIIPREHSSRRPFSQG